VIRILKLNPELKLISVQLRLVAVAGTGR